MYGKKTFEVPVFPPQPARRGRGSEDNCPFSATSGGPSNFRYSFFTFLVTAYFSGQFFLRTFTVLGYLKIPMLVKDMKKEKKKTFTICDTKSKWRR